MPLSHKRMLIIIRAALCFAALSVIGETLACTFCHSYVAEEVRARLFDCDFLANLAMVTLPLLILFGAIFLAAANPSNLGNAR